MTSTVEANKWHHPTLYLADGDVVLFAKPTEKSGLLWAFRVHRVVLSHHSEILRDMFVVGGGGNEQYDGTAAVEMPDNAEDLAALLDTMYNAPKFYLQFLDKYMYDTAFRFQGLITIAQKYMVHDLVDYLQEYIARQWPRSLEEWDYRELELTARNAYHPEPASSIQLLRAAGLDDALPAAFYTLAITPTRNNWETTTSPPKTKGELCARWSELDKQDAMRFAQGRDAMRLHYISVLTKPINYAAPYDRIHDGCRAILGDFRGRMHKQLFLPHEDCLKTIDEFVKLSSGSMCTSCNAQVLEPLQRLREDIWVRLPEYFNLPA